jgi:hypothetical protein
MRRIALWAAAVGAAAAIAVGSAPGASAAPRIPPADDQLVGVACTSTTSCLAVGANFATPSPLAETWGALGWRTIGVKLPAGFTKGALDGVTCPPAKSGTGKSGVECIAVGNSITSSGTSFALADLWNGKAWTPAKASGSAGTVLISVSCLSASYCLAVGGLGTPAGTGRPISDLWNGKKWAQVKVPPPAHAAAGQFSGVSCVSTSFCVATGDAVALDGTQTPLIGEWTGKKWTYLKSAPPTGLTDFALEDVSCPTAKSCVAVGNGALAKGGTSTMIEVWNGKSWARSAAVAWPKGSKNSWLIGMSCYAAGHCVSAGFIDWNPNSGNADTTGRVAAAQWNGKGWASTPIAAPGAGHATMLNAVTCKSAKFCVAVGLAGPFGSPSGTGLSAFWNGKSWKLVGAK